MESLIDIFEARSRITHTMTFRTIVECEFDYLTIFNQLLSAIQYMTVDLDLINAA